MASMLISPDHAAVLLIAFAVLMALFVAFRSGTEHRTEGFLLADRRVPLWQGSLSIAVSWIWAPAIFVCGLQAYQKGLPGIFWFTLPNILCFFVFAPLAVKLRREMPHGYTLPQYIARRFKNHRALHLAYVVVFSGYQIGAMTMNPLAAGYLLKAVSGIEVHTTVLTMTGIALGYSLLSGLKASVFTDVIQMLLILLIGLILVPWCLLSLDDSISLSSALGGVNAAHPSLFDPWVAFTMGIPMTLGLIAGPISDQMFFQRAFAVAERDITRTFVYGGLLFGLVPILLSIPGFIGAALVQAGKISVGDPQVVSVLVVDYLLPKAAVYAFCFMAFAGLCSTMDSAFCAGSSLGAIDVYKRYINPRASDRQILAFSRWCMLGIAALGSSLALLEPKLLWVFLIYGALTSAALFPTVFALYSKKVPAGALFWGIVSSLLIGLPTSVYANVSENPHLIVAAALMSVVPGLLACLGGSAAAVLPAMLSRMRPANSPQQYAGEPYGRQPEAAEAGARVRDK